jgi:2-oxoglutarate dehydrogenase E1 component
MDPIEHSFLNFSNAIEVERYYQKYLENPDSIDPSFRDFFRGMAFTAQPQKDSKASLILKLIDAYRKFGHLKAQLNPVAQDRQEKISHLDLVSLGFSKDALDELFPTCGLMDEKEASLKAINDHLKKIYCKTLGVECDLKEHPEIEEFVFSRIEKTFLKPLDPEIKKRILEELHQALAFEAFIQLRYPGQKRFSIEGGESFISLLKEIVIKAKPLGVEDLFVGMAHRGRLNVLANIFQKPIAEIFSEFESKDIQQHQLFSSDVKYHKGHVNRFEGIEMTLCPNPSHLEAVDPVVMGRARAIQLQKKSLSKVLPIIIHGDAALAGQGIVYETLQMEKLDGFENGGVLHLVINNQIGFTAKSEEGRSTRYCSDIAKAFSMPVFHVNGDDPEMVVKVAYLALEVRQKFQKSVFIDYNCYRKYGHNETDEPRFTQPKLYDIIQSKEAIKNLYANQLISEKVISSADLEQMENRFKKVLDEAHQEKESFLLKKESTHQDEPYPPIIETRVSKELLSHLSEKLSHIPEGFTVHPKLKRMIHDRKENFSKAEKEKILDFAVCEQLAYATLLLENKNIRIVGEDSRRGTFSHRHAVLVDQVNENIYYQLNHLMPHQGQISVYNSFLSEYAAMGYEYGFSVQDPSSLVIWEAQFGDFVNCAQVIVDQFLAAGFQKWQEESSLVLLLPHGYEGMGPEHSSARIERFLQLAAQNNLEIIYPTLASQFFHLFRHQALKKHKTPMVVFAPKALLRHKETYASQADLIERGFLDLVDDPIADPATVGTLVFTTGKLIYDLLDHRSKNGLQNTALIRIEKLYPFNMSLLEKIVARYPNAKQMILAQDEPRNMGAASYLLEIFKNTFPTKAIKVVARRASASTAVGSAVYHQFEQTVLIDDLQKAINGA